VNYYDDFMIEFTIVNRIRIDATTVFQD